MKPFLSPDPFATCFEHDGAALDVAILSSSASATFLFHLETIVIYIILEFSRSPSAPDFSKISVFRSSLAQFFFFVEGRMVTRSPTTVSHFPATPNHFLFSADARESQSADQRDPRSQFAVSPVLF